MEEKDSPKDSGTVSCRECNAELAIGTKFCTECGKPVMKTSDENYKSSAQNEICPKCDAEIIAGARFCMECGTNIKEYSRSKRNDDPVQQVQKTGEDLFKDVEKTGRGLMKDLGGFLDKAASGGSSKKKINPPLKNQGYLVCNKCGGYYQLQKGENPEDFIDTCDCGGKLEHQQTLPAKK